MHRQNFYVSLLNIWQFPFILQLQCGLMWSRHVELVDSDGLVGLSVTSTFSMVLALDAFKHFSDVVSRYQPKSLLIFSTLAPTFAAAVPHVLWRQWPSYTAGSMSCNSVASILPVKAGQLWSIGALSKSLACRWERHFPSPGWTVWEEQCSVRLERESIFFDEGYEEGILPYFSLLV